MIGVWTHLLCKQYWTSPGGYTQQGTKYMATCLPSWKLYKLDEQDTQDTAGEARMNSSVMYSYGHPHMAKQKQDNQLEHTYNSYVRIRNVALKTCQKRWMIGKSGERGSGISVLVARHDDDDDENTEQSSGDLRRLTVTKTPVRNHQLMLVWKTLKSEQIIIIIIIIVIIIIITHINSYGTLTCTRIT